MGKFRIEVDNVAKNDFDKIYKSGDKASIKKLETFIFELAEHPYIGSGQPKQLKHNLSRY